MQSSLPSNQVTIIDKPVAAPPPCLINNNLMEVDLGQLTIVPVPKRKKGKGA